MDQPTSESYTDMENRQLKQENTQYKKIIRENDSRIYYLERKLDYATKYINYLEQSFSDERLHHNRCYSCGDTYLHDEIGCDCNMFCSRALCKSCYYVWKKDVSVHSDDIQLCQESHCNNWICERTDYVYLCKECDKKLCLMHYHERNAELKNWICIQCCEKAKAEYGYESV